MKNILKSILTGNLNLRFDFQDIFEIFFLIRFYFFFSKNQTDQSKSFFKTFISVEHAFFCFLKFFYVF